MPDWKDRSNPSSAGGVLSPGGRARSGSGRQVRGSGPSRSREPPPGRAHFAEWQASDGVPPPPRHRLPRAPAVVRSALGRRRAADPGLAGGAPDRERPGPAAEPTTLLERPAHIVDFCASSGHVALPAAAVLKGVTVEINDLRERPIEPSRASASPRYPRALRARCTARVGSTETHTGPFDIGVALRPRRGDGRGAGNSACAAAGLRARPVLRWPAAQRANRGRNARSSLPKTEAFFAACFDLPKSAVWRGALSSTRRRRLRARATARPRQVDGGRPGAAGLQDGDRRRTRFARKWSGVASRSQAPQDGAFFGITPKNGVIEGRHCPSGGVPTVCAPCDSFL